jgi:hypothetical protein
VRFETEPTPWIATDARAVIHEANPALAAFLQVEAPRLRHEPLIGFVPRRETDSFRIFTWHLGGLRDEEITLSLRPRGGAPSAFRARVVRFAIDSYLWRLGQSSPASSGWSSAP